MPIPTCAEIRRPGPRCPGRLRRAAFAGPTHVRAASAHPTSSCTTRELGAGRRVPRSLETRRLVNWLIDAPRGVQPPCPTAGVAKRTKLVTVRRSPREPRFLWQERRCEVYLSEVSLRAAWERPPGGRSPRRGTARAARAGRRDRELAENRRPRREGRPPLAAVAALSSRSRAAALKERVPPKEDPSCGACRGSELWAGSHEAVVARVGL